MWDADNVGLLIYHATQASQQSHALAYAIIAQSIIAQSIIAQSMICMLTILARYLLGMQDPCQYAGLAISMPTPHWHDTCLACKIYAKTIRARYLLGMQNPCHIAQACLLLGMQVLCQYGVGMLIARLACWHENCQWGISSGRWGVVFMPHPQFGSHPDAARRGPHRPPVFITRTFLTKARLSKNFFLQNCMKL